MVLKDLRDLAQEISDLWKAGSYEDSLWKMHEFFKKTHEYMIQGVDAEDTGPLHSLMRSIEALYTRGMKIEAKKHGLSVGEMTHIWTFRASPEWTQEKENDLFQVIREGKALPNILGHKGEDPLP